MKRCSVCTREFPIEEYYWRDKAKGTRQSACRECCNARSAAHYAADPEPYRKRTRKNAPARRRAVQRFIRARRLVCVDCGIDHPAVLEFHHLDPAEKDVAVALCETIERALREMEKCVVLCANCHRIRHWNELTARAATAR